MDLAEWYAGRRWVALLELIDMLPAACRLNEAIADDPETAAHLASLRMQEADEAKPAWAPRVSEFDLHAVLLREVIQRLDGIYQAAVVQTGNKAPEIPTFPGPRTAIDKAIEAAERDWAEGFVQQFGFDPEDI
ncbi:hypothetical protein [Sinomonas susongensis]|uniref:hypothetical protein n=1 Tax=Sinomonas susongensis TaxID=1324851 RepID=UPI001107DA53|nr:hypothetical protein [Sinomonas susongensis]